MKGEPILVLLLPAVLVEAGGAADALATNHTTAGVFLAVGTFLTGVGGALARSLVTPLTKRNVAAQGHVVRERQSF